MDDEEPVLLHEQDLMLALLRATAAGPATIEDAVALLEGVRRQARAAPADDPALLRSRMADAAQALQAARCLERVGGERLRLTGRGRDLLAAEPGGIDETVLMRFPDYAAYVAGRAAPHHEADPRQDAFDQGAAAYVAGQSYAENPHALDSVDHLAWQNGWSVACDEARRTRDGHG